MTPTTLHPHNLAHEVQNVSGALRELAGASRRLIVALLTTMLQRQAPNPKHSARQEADKLRAYADTLYRDDPRFAEDLYAAATRHESAVG